MEKLVRDHIPQIMIEAGHAPRVRRAAAEERSGLLTLKLREECDELVEAFAIDEFADVLEVLRALAEQVDIPWDQVEHRRQQKAAERGAFAAGHVLISVAGPERPSPGAS